MSWLLLNAEANTEVDLTAVNALEGLRTTLQDKGIRLAMARVKEDLRVQLEAADFVDRVGADYIFPTLPVAVGAYAEWYEQEHGVPLPEIQTPSGPVRPSANG